ncbi:phosphodiester glycosidase family protein [Clostridium sp. MB40-C1]|uniref:phosphodiester glycosidase family protein n=1 Tax=Clostridium sp. MB40-C1 TaxID=3070996 RepID=UPI0027DF6253|nr:phosphodiester glycosidase family protein [Clostridium sp. MB40-C1]WMJ81692.1 phosphodiester glycosidase family protein [Clostridium sp. MB40-C1]
MRTKLMKNSKKNEASLCKKLALFLILEFIFTAIVFPFYAFYGPFKKVRNTIVGLSMSTGNHLYIAKTFFNDDDIKKILQENNDELNSPQLDHDISKYDKIDLKNTNTPIKRLDISTNKFDGIALIIKDPLKIKVGYSSKLGHAGETVSEMAKHYNALVAINGGGFLDVSPNGKTGGTGGIPSGIMISRGNVIYPKEKKNYTIKEDCVFAIDANGHMYVGPATTKDLINKNIQEAISFSPTLIVNGNPFISKNSLGGMNPRTAIGQRKDGSIILLTIDGRQGLKLGASLRDVQNIMLKLDAVNAMCLDGGGSTAMYYNNEIINNPSSVTGERAIPNIVYVEP